MLYDRHTNYNPVKYVDPSGHCIVLTNDYGESCYNESNGEFNLGSGDAFNNEYEVGIANWLMTGDTENLNILNQIREEPLGFTYISRMLSTTQSLVGGDGSGVILDQYHSVSLNTKVMTTTSVVEKFAPRIINGIYNAGVSLWNYIVPSNSSPSSQSNMPLGVLDPSKIVYPAKTRAQMANSNDKYHSFPLAVDQYLSTGEQFKVVGGDGITRIAVHIPGMINDKTGYYQYLFELDGVTVFHRLFVEVP